MFLSQLKLDLRNRITQNWIQNPYHIHQRLWMAFGDGTIGKDFESAPFLYQLELHTNSVPSRILVFSDVLPDWKRAFTDFSVLEEIPKENHIKQISPAFIQPDAAFRFSVTANPTKKVKDYRSLFIEELKDFPKNFDYSNQKLYRSGKAKLEELKKTVTKEQRENLKSKKVGIYLENDQLEWIHKKALDNGFSLLEVMIEKESDSSASKTKRSDLPSIPKIHTVTFSGILRITDPEKFKIAYTKGIGSGKAFGCGMLLLARV
ncbi:type I-E CRISPR-associated protein Cas6/Cse3/CasE [Leptospira stimsonii]|uniref:Type I-E CRISPR-associated protein Cas6/Cse3/CasE n=1 Tax=Leptospira stimsonii TaxID=2202203 RepID=A0A8B3CKA1_9LEPT|nr:type I-E CRISPR-associated protein Cas6/Cse3/CasE [Leptospira stimsonii]RHX83882.1 type I-E CRISPR-associated protein Cas6/Cse3/CasE [Leptospira stimsonii]